MLARLALILSLAASPSFSHEFELLLVAPDSATEATLEQMRAAFLIASHERDAHPDETSEGHLGGMDVQLTLARMNGAEPTADLAFVVAPMAEPGNTVIVELAAPGAAVVVDSGHLKAMQQGLDQGDATTLPFSDRFQAETGQPPGAEALAVYLSVRLVDLAVRPLGSVNDRDALRRGLPDQ